jgi:putative aldouronate transport system permease protein
MILPGLVFFIIFKYAPMFGITIAFKEYIPWIGFSESSWVGLYHFEKFFSSFYFLKVLFNTLIISLYKIIFVFPIPILFAVLLNELKSDFFKRITQSISYLPHFLSMVIVAGIVYTLFSTTDGVVNQIINAVGGEKINFLKNPKYFRTIIVGIDLWTQLGWNSIIYIAAISNINPELYNVAVMDGANKLQRIVYVTIPSIAETVLVMFILRLGYILSAGFEPIFLLYSPIVYEVADIIDTYVYREGIINSSFSFATAVGLFKSVVGLCLIVATNYVSKKKGYNAIW